MTFFFFFNYYKQILNLVNFLEQPCKATLNLLTSAYGRSSGMWQTPPVPIWYQRCESSRWSPCLPNFWHLAVPVRRLVSCLKPHYSRHGDRGPSREQITTDVGALTHFLKEVLIPEAHTSCLMLGNMITSLSGNVKWSDKDLLPINNALSHSL